MLTQNNTLAQNISVSDSLPEWAEEFYRAKIVQGLADRSIIYYQQQLGHFLTYADGQVIERVSLITPKVVRGFLLWMKETGHNPGGVHGAYRSLRAFLNWYEREVEPAGWKNPIAKVDPPKVPTEPIEPVEIPDVFKMVEACDVEKFTGRRDRAFMLFLLDTGVRVREMLALRCEDIDLIACSALVRQGKGRKPRYVFMGEKTLAAIREYLQDRQDDLAELWVTDDKTKRLTYGGARQMLIKHSAAAGVSTPSPHDFRRAFALNMLRNGCDLVTLARLMGHTSTTVLWRYLYQVTDDLKAAHKRNGPVDNYEDDKKTVPQSKD